MGRLTLARYLSVVEKSDKIRIESEHPLADWDVYEYMYSSGPVNVYGYVGSTGWKDPLKVDRQDDYSDFLIDKCLYCGTDFIMDTWEIAHHFCHDSSSDYIKVDLSEYAMAIRESGVVNHNIMTIDDFEVFARVEKYGRDGLKKCPGCGTKWIPPEVVKHLGDNYFKCVYCRRKIIKYEGRLETEYNVELLKKIKKGQKQLSIF